MANLSPRSIALTAQTQDKRFPFGQNWREYASRMDEHRVQAAENSLREMLNADDLAGLRFLDIGCGSGLLSLAAWRLKADVRGFDYDPDSVACTLSLRRDYAGNQRSWKVEQGSVLDGEFVRQLGVYDIVYAWGVLHHTGSMWQALNNCACCVDRNGRLFIAIYNNQGWKSQYWLWIKRLYNQGALSRGALVAIHAPYFVALRWLVRHLGRRGSLARGMSLWYDMKDWLGGLPFETAKPEEILAFLRPRGFELERLVTCGGRHGCNEYVFVKR